MKQDLRRWLREAEAAGELATLEAVDWRVEMGSLADLVGRQPQNPALLFIRIPGYPAGHRVLVNTLASPARLARTAGLPAGLEPLAAVRAWKERYAQIDHRPHQVVADGPLMENQQTGSDVDLFSLPAPLWRSGDGGRYLGTATLCVTRSPEDSSINVATARVMIHDRNQVFYRVSAGKDSRRHFEEARRQNGRLPIAISLGHDPSLVMVGGLNIPYGLCEYDVWGGLMEETLEVVETPIHGLPVPSHAEVVIEGEVLTEQTAEEGPFGEWSGYYSRSPRPEPLIEVQAVYHRDDPIVLAISTSRPPSELTTFWAVFRSALLWQQLEQAGVGEIHGVWCHPAAGTRLFIALALRQTHPGHARQVLMAAASLPAGAYMGRYLVAVDEDIDVTDLDSVLWALGTRSDPERDADLIRGAWGGPLDPAVGPESGGLNSRLLIDACRPYGRPFPEVAGFSAQETERAKQLWRRYREQAEEAEIRRS